MSAYEDIGLSYVSLNESTYGKMQFANPIGASEAFVVVVKAKANGNPADNNPKILTIGIASSTLGSGGLAIEGASADGRATINHYAQTVTKQIGLSSVSGTSTKLNDGEDHIFIVSVPAGAGTMVAWADSESKTNSVAVSTGFSSSLGGITLNGRVNNANWTTAPTERGTWNISWLAVYSSLDVNGRAALFAGASPLTVGTLRSGDSCWVFDGNGNEYNGGTPFTFTGSPTFVQPAYRNVLDVTDSYLSLDATQYAQASIGAGRLATTGNGTNLYGAIPAWTATNWEIEFDVVLPTTASATAYYFFDSDADSNRRNFALGTGGVFTRTLGNYQGYLDGSLITFSSTPHPLDGAVHHIKLVSDAGTNPTTVGKILTRYINANYGNMAIFNLSLKDLDTPANSRFYPMDEGNVASTFTDTSANAQHGTWFNRSAGNVSTVYPDAVKPSDAFVFAVKFRVPVIPTSKIIAALGRYETGNASFTLGFNGSNQLYASRVKQTTSINTATLTGETLLPNTEYIAVAKCNADRTINLYLNSLNTTASAAAGNAYERGMNFITLNGVMDGTLTATSKTDVDIYYAYVYNTLSPADIAALMQGEHPASVGNVRQGYNLAGDGNEVSGGPALTLYNSPRFYMPSKRGLVNSLVNKLVSSLTCNLVSR